MCNSTCEGTDDPLDENFGFTVSLATYRFNRYTFRRAVGLKLVYNQFAVVDKEVDSSSFTFGFTPREAGKLTSKQVCAALDVEFLSNLYSCCLRNTTTDAPTLSVEDLAAQEIASHRTQLIVCWISIAAATVYLVYLTKKNTTTKDSAMEMALDLATQKDDDEL